MGQILSDIFHYLNRSHGIVVLGLAAVLLLWRRGGVLSFFTGSRFISRLGTAAAGILILTYLGVLILAQISIGYFDHLEPLVASISWIVVHGGPGYPDVDTGDLYGGLYGPLLLWITGAALLIYPGMAATKLVAAAAFAMGAGIIWGMSSRLLLNWRIRLLMGATLIALVVPYRYSAYWVRPEPFLFLISSLAILASKGRNPWVRIIIVGLLAGSAVNLKIHGFLYVLPVGLQLLGSLETTRRRILGVAGAALAAGIAFLAPVLADPSVIRLYSVYLPLAAGHGLSPTATVENLELAAGLMSPALLFFFWRRPHLSRDQLWFAVGLAASSAAVIVLGSKVGALPNYLFPMVPSFFWFAAEMLAASPSRHESSQSQTGLAATAFLLVFASVAGTWALMVEAPPRPFSRNAEARAKSVELTRWISAYPNAEMGPGDPSSYPDTYFGPLQVMRNGILHIGVPAWMDLREGGVSEAAASRFIENCSVHAWVLPAGAPFSVETPYTERQLFSAEFQSAFAANYQQVAQGQFYSVWACRTH
jgi:hypothetical protein